MYYWTDNTVPGEREAPEKVLLSAYGATRCVRDGLYAEFKWTGRARGYLESGESRYTSPAFYRDKKTAAWPNL